MNKCKKKLATTTFLIFAQSGPYGLWYKILGRRCTRLRVPFGTRLQCSLRSEASEPRQLEILNAAVKFMGANWP